MRRRKGRIGSESGQAIIEYILVLIIVVIIIFSVLYRFSTAFRAWGNNYFTNYIACLLDYGELPGFGGCTDQMKTFSLAEGRVRSEGSMDGRMSGGGGGGGGGSSPGGNGGGGSNSSGGGQDGSGDKSASRGDSDGSSSGGDGSSGGNDEVIGSGGGGGGTTAVGRVNRFGGRSRSTPEGNVRSTSEGGAGGESDSLLGVSPTSTSVGAIENRRRTTASLQWGYGEEEKKDRERNRPASASAGAPSSVGGDELRPKTAVEKVRESTGKKVDLNDEGFSFGKLIKMLLIIAIIVAILVFFGGQVLQMTKSWDSN